MRWSITRLGIEASSPIPISAIPACRYASTMTRWQIFRFVRSRMSKEFGFLRGRIGIRSLLSMVTLPPDRLSFMQRICHVGPNADAGRAKYAALLYLFHDEWAVPASIAGRTSRPSGKAWHSCVKTPARARRSCRRTSRRFASGRAT